MVGLRNGYQTALVMSGISTKIHAKRLAQATEVVLGAQGCRYVPPPPEAGVPHTEDLSLMQLPESPCTMAS